MTPFMIFALFGLPMSLVALGWGAVFLHGRGRAKPSRSAPDAIRANTAR